MSHGARRTRLLAALVAAAALGGCAVVTVAGAAIGLAGAVVSTGVSLGGKAVGAVIVAASDDDDERERAQ